MKPIILKEARLRTTIARAKIRKAVEDAFAKLGLMPKTKTNTRRAAKNPGRRNKSGVVRNQKNLHVVPLGNRWTVKKEGYKRYTIIRAGFH
jgi:hypothetical protein